MPEKVARIKLKPRLLSSQIVSSATLTFMPIPKPAPSLLVQPITFTSISNHWLLYCWPTSFYSNSIPLCSMTTTFGIKRTLEVRALGRELVSPKRSWARAAGSLTCSFIETFCNIRRFHYFFLQQSQVLSNSNFYSLLDHLSSLHQEAFLDEEMKKTMRTLHHLETEFCLLKSLLWLTYTTEYVFMLIRMASKPFTKICLLDSQSNMKEKYVRNNIY